MSKCGKHQCVINTLNTMCVAIVAVFNASNIGNDLTGHSRAVNNYIHCATWMSKGQWLIQLLRHQHPKQERLWCIRQGLLEGAVLRAQSLPGPLRLHSECSLKPRHGIYSAVTSKKVPSMPIVQLAGIEDLLSLKEKRQIGWPKQHDSIARPRGFFVRHRCSAQACALEADNLRIRNTHTYAPAAKSRSRLTTAVTYSQVICVFLFFYRARCQHPFNYYYD